LTYQMMYELRDIGFSTAVGIGGDPVIGTTHIDCLEAFENDPDTVAIVMIGEIGGDAEERAAAYIKDHVTKPVVGYVAGFTAPEGKTMGHAGAIVTGSAGTAAAKKEALEAAGVKVGKTPSEAPCGRPSAPAQRSGCSVRGPTSRWGRSHSPSCRCWHWPCS
jgi:succinyl-CoA synthetase alpha subunit